MFNESKGLTGAARLSTLLSPSKLRGRRARWDAEGGAHQSAVGGAAERGEAGAGESGLHDEANIPAQEPPQEKDARIPRTHEEHRGASGAQAPPSQGTQASGRLTAAPRQKFPSTLRLSRRSEFRSVYDQGVRVAGGALVLFVRPSGRAAPRIGLTAAKRVGGAVERNRLRRRAREAFRRNRAEFGPWDLVVNFKPGAATCTAAEIEAELLALARRARRALAKRPPEAGR